MNIKAIAFESNERKGKYVSDEIDVPTVDENGETDVLEDALLVIRTDLKPPTKKDLDDCYTLFSKLKFFDYKAFRELSKPVKVRSHKNSWL